ncbi:hypothetical protein MINTM019_20740 [Mycobacterium paraintracellulare]|nr:hypothetical protein MINTM019_20740 [Mycobacterium paraintracellulare]
MDKVNKRTAVELDISDTDGHRFTRSGPFTHQRSAVRYRPRPLLLAVRGRNVAATLGADFRRAVTCAAPYPEGRYSGPEIQARAPASTAACTARAIRAPNTERGPP